MRYKLFGSVFLIILLLMPMKINATYSVESNPLDEMVARELPDSLQFSVSNTCSGHTYFNQAVAEDNGYVAVYSDFIESEHLDNDTYQRAYVEIYGPEGNFILEFSFKTKAGRSIDIHGNIVLVYLFDTAIAYNYMDREVSYYSFPENSEPYAYKTSAEKTFTAGEWEYECQRSYGNFTKLIRRNGNCEQILVDFPGTKKQFWTRLVPGMLIGISGFVVCIILKNRKKKATHGSC